VAGQGRKNADERLLVALAGGLTVRAAAKACGVSERTIHRRLDDQAFQQRIAEARAKLVKGSIGRLARAGTSAVRTLEHISRQGKTEACRVAASRTILDHLFRSFELYEMEERLATLEARERERTEEIP
jgi:hypothetical protein